LEKKVGVIKLYKIQALPYKENNRHSRKSQQVKPAQGYNGSWLSKSFRSSSLHQAKESTAITV